MQQHLAHMQASHSSASIRCSGRRCWRDCPDMCFVSAGDYQGWFPTTSVLLNMRSCCRRLSRFRASVTPWHTDLLWMLPLLDIPASKPAPTGSLSSRWHQRNGGVALNAGSLWNESETADKPVLRLQLVCLPQHGGRSCALVSTANQLLACNSHSAPTY
jgi:hypothetical protein